jgi:RND family efflux transporter MFP subunit
MKFKGIIVAFVLFAILFIANGCEKADGAENSAGKKEDSSYVNVEVQQLKTSNFTDYLTVLGSLKPVRKAQISYQEGGKLLKKVNEKGSFVAEGDTIVIIENDVLKANLDAAEAQYMLAKVTFDKQEEIRKENIGSEFQYLQSKYNMQQAKANYDLMKARYDKTYITAPFSGVVDNIYYEVGEMAMPGSPVINLISSGRLKVEAGVPERYAGKVKIGTKAVISFATLDIEPIEGIVTFVGSSIFVDNRTFPVEIELNNQERILKPELVAEVKIATSNYSNIITVPDEIVSNTDKGYLVYIAENGKAKARLIDILSRSGDKIAVKSGLKEGDDLIVVGYQNLLDGDNVKIVN